MMPAVNLGNGTPHFQWKHCQPAGVQPQYAGTVGETVTQILGVNSVKTRDCRLGQACDVKIVADSVEWVWTNNRWVERQRQPRTVYISGTVNAAGQLLAFTWHATYNG